MRIVLESAGKKFFRNWIFRNLALELNSPEKIAILGPNGSGKSTLLQVLSGQLSLSEGTIKASNGSSVVEPDSVFKHVSIATPYLDLIEEFTLMEIVDFHFKFKQPVNKLTTKEIIEIAQLENSKDKVFKYFSSGMKQRAKLSLAILSEVDLVLLDEPLTNLDKAGMQWYKQLAGGYLKDKITVVCSNHDSNEYEFCEREVNIMEYK